MQTASVNTPNGIHVLRTGVQSSSHCEQDKFARYELTCDDLPRRTFDKNGQREDTALTRVSNHKATFTCILLNNNFTLIARRTLVVPANNKEHKIYHLISKLGIILSNTNV